MNRSPIISQLFNLLLLLLICQAVKAQIPSNDQDRPCVNEKYIEDFSSSIPSGWEGDFMLLEPPLSLGWVLGSGSTPTDETGPDEAFSGEHYLFFESSGPAGTKTKFAVRTGVIDLTHVQEVSPTVRFRVLMYGEQMGSLTVNVLTGSGYSTSETVLQIVGEQHNSGDVSNWEEAFLDITRYEGQQIKLEFVGMKAEGGLGDIAIDFLQVCDDPRIPTLGEWGIVVLGLFMIILGVVYIRTQQQKVYSLVASTQV